MDGWMEDREGRRWRGRQAKGRFRVAGACGWCFRGIAPRFGESWEAASRAVHCKARGEGGVKNASRSDKAGAGPIWLSVALDAVDYRFRTSRRNLLPFEWLWSRRWEGKSAQANGLQPAARFNGEGALIERRGGAARTRATLALPSCMAMATPDAPRSSRSSVFPQDCTKETRQTFCQVRCHVLLRCSASTGIYLPKPHLF
jgi:hypothetical protein